MLNNRAFACLLSAAFPLAIRLCFLPWMPVPEPSVHDEFSYLLGADTFASGRLTNPPHPFWQHFESFHILQQPTYASKYPPMQALFLALGQKLGHPWIGVLLSVAAMFGALCWMLQGWVSPPVALIGALVAGLRLGVFSYWMNSYWGGAVPATGGALVIGAFARLLRHPRRFDAFLFTIGLVILANSRPYEGLLLAAPTTLLLVAKALRSGTAGSLFKVAAIPLLATLIPAISAMGYYNYRVTNDPLLLPYQAHERQYAVASSFLWQKLRSVPSYRHPVMRSFWVGFDVKLYERARAHLISHAMNTVAMGICFTLLWSPVAIFGVLAPRPRGQDAGRISLFLLALPLLGLALNKFPLPHYVAPACGVIFARFSTAMQSLAGWRVMGRRLGAVLVTCVVGLILLDPLIHRSGIVMTDLSPLRRERRAVVSDLTHRPGKHIVLLRYSPSHWPLEEWVYNGATIDSQTIVWAREMGDDSDRALLSYFSDRTAWLLQPDEDPPKLILYPSSRLGSQ